MTLLPLAPFTKVLREEGAEKVSPKAARELRNEVEKFARAAAEMSVFAAKHGNRKTVMDIDVQLAVR
jgi:histone H3/H4